MPEHIVVDDLNCPICDSPLASIDFDAGDDALTRRSYRHVDWWVRYVGFFALIIIPLSLGYLLSLWTTENTRLARLYGMLEISFALVVLGIWVRAFAKLWWRIRTRRSGRLVTCLACGHRWRLP